MGVELVPFAIDLKMFASEALSIPTGTAYFITIMLTAVLPVAVAVTGGVICYFRKRS